MNETYKTPKITVQKIDPQDLVCTSTGGSTDISVGGEGQIDAKRRSPIWDDYDN